MAFDFTAAIKQAAEMTSSKALEAIILGPSGAGKSYLLGTMGVKTLYLYAQGENHGVASARVTAKDNIVPVCIDYDDVGNPLSADDTYNRLLAILDDIEGIKSAKFGAIVVDGASELEIVIRQTAKFKKLCTAANGKFNSFAEPSATLELFRPFINALKNVQMKLDIHYAMTLILDVKEMGPDGQYETATPRLRGYSVAEGVLQQFADVLVVGKMQREDKIKYCLQFATELTKTSKEENGNIKKSLNFSPRLSGITVPNLLPADLSGIIKLKAEQCK